MTVTSEEKHDTYGGDLYGITLLVSNYKHRIRITLVARPGINSEDATDVHVDL